MRDLVEAERTWGTPVTERESPFRGTHRDGTVVRKKRECFKLNSYFMGILR